VNHALEPGRHAWLQVLRGAVTLHRRPLKTGDGAAVSEEDAFTIIANQSAEVMLFDFN
jgi:redox-sensitive bicupin YhaK (pirin superfamily)